MSNRFIYAIAICLIIISVFFGFFLRWRSTRIVHTLPSGTYRSNDVTVTDDPYGLLPQNTPPPNNTDPCTADSRRCEPIKTYASNHLGVTFQVYKSAKVLEEGNRIYADGKEGQYLEVLPKNEAESLYDVVSRLEGPLDKCSVVVQAMAPRYTNDSGSMAGRAYPDSYSTVTVLPNPEDWDRLNADPPKDAWCKAQFVSLDGLRFYLADVKHPNVYVRVSVGQYSVPAGRDTDWQNTIRFK